MPVYGAGGGIPVEDHVRSVPYHRLGGGFRPRCWGLTGHCLCRCRGGARRPQFRAQPGRAFNVQTSPGNADNAGVDPEISELTAVSIRKDGFGGILACSDSIREVFGWEPAALVGARSLEYIHPNDHDDVVNQWMAMLEQPGST